MEINGKTVVIALLAIGLLTLGGFYASDKGWLKFGEVVTTPSTGTAAQIIYVGGQQQPSTVVVSAPTATQLDGGAYPVEDLKAQGKNMFTEAATTSGDIMIYTLGADVSDPYIQSIDNVSLAAGLGNTSGMMLMTNTAYDWYFNGKSTYYDELMSGVTISYNKDTGKGTTLFNGVPWYPAKPIGTFVNQSNLPEVSAAMNDTGAAEASTTVWYDKSLGAGSGWIKMDIGNSASNSVLKDVVLCFSDTDADMENNELTDLSASYVSGSTGISVPPSLFKYWQDAMGGTSSQCVLIANELGSSEQARWKFDFTIDETNMATEEFEICFDDLGDYLQKEYPSRNAKATAACVVIADQS
jgi:hypothetical protein